MSTSIYGVVVDAEALSPKLRGFLFDTGKETKATIVETEHIEDMSLRSVKVGLSETPKDTIDDC